MARRIPAALLVLWVVGAVGVAIWRFVDGSPWFGVGWLLIAAAVAFAMILRTRAATMATRPTE